MPLPRTTDASSHRRTTTAGRVLTACVLTALGGCGGAPPQPLPTAPPRPGSLPSGPLQPGSVPTLPGLPTGALPTYPGPTYPGPTYPGPTYTVPPRTLPTSRTPTTRPTTPPPPPAPKCRSGPTAAQVLAVVNGKPGVPTGEELKVTTGPFCAGTWQFSTVVLKSKPNSEPLLVVTKGKPAELTLIEAGADVCSERVQNQAPPGIRVLACGF